MLNDSSHPASNPAAPAVMITKMPLRTDGLMGLDSDFDSFSVFISSPLDRDLWRHSAPYVVPRCLASFSMD